jgi:hypothetical protein
MQIFSNDWIKSAVLSVAFLFAAGSAYAQVAATVGSITGRPGTDVSIPVTITGNDATDIQSFSFTVDADAGVTLTGVSTTGSLAGTAGFSVNANTTTGVVGGFSQGTDIATDGVLVYLNMTLGDDGDNGSMTVTDLVFNAGDPATGVVTAGSFVVSDRIMSVDDVSVGETASFEIVISLDDALTSDDGVVSFNMDLSYDDDLMEIDTSVGVNGVVASGITAGATVNGSAVDADTYRIAGFAGSALTGEGAFVTIAATSKVPGTGALSLSNVVFNAGEPTYALIDGTLTVTATNFAPVFTSVLSDTSVLEDGADVTFDYDATDANGDALTYSATVGTIDATTGEWSIDPSGKAGVHTVSVSVTDGVNTATTSAVLTIKQVDNFETSLSGYNEVPPVASVASGSATMRMVADDGLLEVTFSATNLAGTMTSAHIHMGGVGENGGVALNLSPSGGTFTETYDITGNTDLVTAMRTGMAYVNVHSTAYPSGELRGQILGAGNSAPAAAATVAPALVNVAGDAESTAFSIAWLPVADPDGDKVNYLMQTASDAAFTSVIGLRNFGASNGIAYSIAEAAELFASLTNNDPASDGTTASLYHRVITTDGSLWTAGPTSSTALRRGAVTDTETGAELPTEFALKGNYPNPFNPTTSISFDLPETADVTVQVLDLLGREVMAIPSQTVHAGANQTVQIDASSLSSGIYLYRVIARTAGDTHMQVKTMTLLK